MANREYIQESAKTAWRLQEARDKTTYKGLLRMLLWAVVGYCVLEFFTHMGQVGTFLVSANEAGDVGQYAKRGPDWSAVSAWAETNLIDASDATFIVTAALLFVATFNVASIASALEPVESGRTQLPGQLTRLWWRQQAGGAAAAAAVAALIVSATQFPQRPGLGIPLIFLSVLTAFGSQLSMNDTEIHTSKLLGVAYLSNEQERYWRAYAGVFTGAARLRMYAKLKTDRRAWVADVRYGLLGLLLDLSIVALASIFVIIWGVLVGGWANRSDFADIPLVVALNTLTDVGILLGASLVIVGAS